MGKLVRDRIPERIKRDGGRAPRTRILVNDVDYRSELGRKLVEESSELHVALAGLAGGSTVSRVEKVIDELADVEEILAALRATLGIRASNVRARIKLKRKERGGFEGRVYLEDQ